VDCTSILRPEASDKMSIWPARNLHAKEVLYIYKNAGRKKHPQTQTLQAWSPSVIKLRQNLNAFFPSA